MTVRDPSEVLGVERRFDLAESEIVRAWLRGSAGSHPDRGGASGEASAALNEAKETLEDPERRADALLRLMGGAGASEDRTLPPELLAETMEIRERLEEAVRSGDEGARGEIEAWALERRAGHEAEVGRLFASVGDPPDEATLRAIRVELNAWRYTERLIEQLDPDYDPFRAPGG